MKTDQNARTIDTNLDIPVLTLAALLGEEFTIDWIQAISGEKPTKVLDAMEQGVDQGILKRLRMGAYAFRNPKAQADGLSSYSEDERTMLHRRIAGLIQDEFSDEEDMVPVLAHQLMQAANSVDDYRTLYEAGEAFRRAFQQQDALQCYGKVIRYLESLEGNEADRLFVNAVCGYARIFSPFEDPAWIIARIGDAMVRAARAGIRPIQALLRMHLAGFEWYNGHYRKAIGEFNTGWAIAKEMQNTDIIRRSLTFRMYFFFWQSRYYDVIRAYEEDIPVVSRYPRSRFPVASAGILGLCFAFCGRITEGLGMLENLEEHCRSIGLAFNQTEASLSRARVLLEIRRIDQATQILEGIRNIGVETLHRTIRHLFHCYYAEAFAIKRDYESAEAHIGEDASLVHLPEWHIYAMTSDGLNQMAADTGGDALYRLSGLSLEQIIRSGVRSKDIFARGMGYLCRARLLRNGDRPPKEILKALKLSMKWIEASGHQIQLAKVRFELARVYLQLGHRARARDAVAEAGKVLAPIDPSLIPDDLASLFENQSVRVHFAEEMSTLGQEIIAIRDERELVLRILSAINQLTGAERGAIFIVENHSGIPDLKLKAARILTEDQIAHPSFGPAMDVIRDTIADGNSRIVKMNPTETAESSIAGRHDAIRSCFCVPMVLKGETIGALYHDNRIFDCLLQEADLDILAFLAGQAAIALDNARAHEEIRDLNQQLLDEKQYYVERDTQRFQSDDIIGRSPAMLRVLDQINRVAGQDTVVLIQGETGVGKELIARAIQKASNRKERPFISADCSALSETLVTSELFGHEKGAFTGASARKVGRFELANGGTLFLDEIGNVPMDVQVRLLRVLQTGEFQRVGGIDTIRSDFRLITATNKDLGKEVASGHFREDLYYRLNVFPITVPPLRERRDDIPLLALYFLRMHSEKMGKPFENMPKAQMNRLVEYPWPGNVRELQNVVERGVILSDGPHFRVPELVGTQGHSPESDMVTLAENERRHILRVIEKTEGKINGKNGAAQYLGVPHSTLYSKMKKLGIESGRRQGL